MVAILIREETLAEPDTKKVYVSRTKEAAENSLITLGYTFRADYNVWVMREYHSTYYATIFTDVKELK